MRLRNKTRSLFLPVFFTLLAACNNSDSIHVRNVKILYKENQSLRSVLHDNDWKTIANISNIQLPYSSPNKLSYVWLRGEFYIESDPNHYYGIYLGKTHDTDTVYINNRRIGSKMPHSPIDLNMPSLYNISPGILAMGKNEVYIRVGIYGIYAGVVRAAGGITSEVLIQPKDNYNQTQFWINLLCNQIFVWIIIVLSAFAFSNFIHYIIDKKVKIRLLFSLILILNIIAILSLFVPYKYIEPELFKIILGAGIPIYIGLSIILYQTMYGIIISKQNKIVISIMGLFAFSVLISGFFGFIIICSALIILSMISGFAYLGYLLYILNSIKPNQFRLYFLSSVFVVMAVCIAWEVLAPIVGFYCPDLLNFYLLPFYSILFIIYGAQESKKTRIQFEQLYNKLKELKPAKPTMVTITYSSEEKLAQVIQFINENYTSNLSREGLAAAIDINPNYLSSLFNAYTGKKINEYINFLRIKEAARLLQDTDKKIIDIAFSIGFESLSTFIRAFKNEMGKTPTEYRAG
jgi:AraC-like DNA-binding protein